MNEPTAVEAPDPYSDAMGEPLSEQFRLLWQEVAWLHIKWSELVEIFGTNEERIRVLNKSAPSFFRMVEHIFWQDIMLHLTRLTDPAQSLGKDNLTVTRLPDLVRDGNKNKQQISELVRIAQESTKFCRDWRNRQITHMDLKLALGQEATALAPASRDQVAIAIGAISEVLYAVRGAYMGSSPPFEAGYTIGGSADLLRVLDDGVRSQAKRRERIARGEWSDEDYWPAI